MTFTQVGIKSYCSDYDMEACALKIHLNKTLIYILTIYRSPAEDFAKFLRFLGNILNFLMNSRTEIIICGDTNVNYLTNNNRKYQLNSILNSYNLFDIVDFPTTTQDSAVSVIDNIFIEYSRMYNCSILPCYNGISDQDVQLLTNYNIDNTQSIPNSYVIRKVNQTALTELNFQLRFQLWEDSFKGKEINEILNCFLNTFLRNFYSACQKIGKKSNNNSDNRWITPKIRILCNLKKDFYLLNNQFNNQILNYHYKFICKTLRKAINDTKRYYFDRQIINSMNKIQTTWNTVKSITGRKSRQEGIFTLNINDNIISDQQFISNSFDEYFPSTAELVFNYAHHNSNIDTSTSDEYLSNFFLDTFPSTNIKFTSSKDTENIIKTLRSSNAFGYDEISTNVLKAYAKPIISPLAYTHTCN
jgi:hypothetical protein